jgi:two-component system, chemotaxis family, response regulator Rcp1
MDNVPSILVIDDDAGDIQLVHRALSDLAYDATLYAVQSVELAASFLSAEGAFAGLPRPDLVVLDLHLPQLAGDRILNEVAAAPATRDIPVIVVTGSDAVQPIGRASAVLRKPCDPGDLVAAVQHHLH